MVKSCNIYWRDAQSKGFPIERVGKAYVAKEGLDRLRVFWLGQEVAEAVTWLESAALKKTEAEK